MASPLGPERQPVRAAERSCRDRAGVRRRRPRIAPANRTSEASSCSGVARATVTASANREPTGVDVIAKHLQGITNRSTSRSTPSVIRVPSGFRPRRGNGRGRVTSRDKEGGRPARSPGAGGWSSGGFRRRWRSDVRRHRHWQKSTTQGDDDWIAGEEESGALDTNWRTETQFNHPTSGMLSSTKLASMTETAGWRSVQDVCSK